MRRVQQEQLAGHEGAAPLPGRQRATSAITLSRPASRDNPEVLEVIGIVRKTR